MEKHNFEAKVKSVRRYNSGLLHLVLTCEAGMPEMVPGQFVELRVDKARVLLNRPISIFNRTAEELELLVSPVGVATKELCNYCPGDSIGVVGPLGKGFTTDFGQGAKILLVGGGVGIAPLYYLARTLKDAGHEVETIYGSRTAPDKEICGMFEAVAKLNVCTDDGSAGFHGLVTNHPAFNAEHDFIQVCGPKPMMKAVVKLSAAMGVETEVSLENHMACGIGACLCCVEDTVDGNVCVCKNGPVFNSKLLKWI